MPRVIPLFLLGAMITIAASPFWRQPAPFYYSDDGLFHLFRAFEFDRIIRAGELYPRWAPDLMNGYGYPLFDFYPPLAYFVIEALHGLGLTFPGAIQSAIVIVLALGGCGAYVLSAQLMNERFAVLTTAALIFSPYFLFDLYSRGAIAEGFAAAFLPWTIWSMRSTLTREAIGNIPLAAFFFAMLILSHNLTALLAFPFIATYAGWEIIHLSAPVRLIALCRGGLSLLLGGMLSAIYWVPSLTEFSLVALSRQSDALAELIVENLVKPDALFQLAAPYEYGDAPFPIPWLPFVLGLIGFFAILMNRRSFDAFYMLLLFFLFTLVGVLLQLESAARIWIEIPYLRVVQYPWRILVLVQLGIALLIGSLPVALTALSNRQTFDRIKLPVGPGDAFAGVLIIVLVWFGIKNLTPQQLYFPPDDLTLAQLARFEQGAQFGGLGNMFEYLPTSVRALPQKLDVPRASPTAPNIALEHSQGAAQSFKVSAQEPFSLTLRSFYFPNWRATIDGQPAPVYPRSLIGLRTLDVPAGNHYLVFFWEDSLAQRFGVWLFILGLFGSGVLILYGLIRKQRAARFALIAFASALAGFAPVAVIASAARPLELQTSQIAFSPELKLIGIHFDNARLDSNVWRVVKPEASLHGQIFWQVLQPLQDRPFEWRLRDAAGNIGNSSKSSSRFGTGFAATWMPNEIVEDYFDLPLTVEMPPGRYQLEAAFGNPHQFIEIGLIYFENASPALSPMAPIAKRLDAQLGESIHLLGYDAPRQAKPGEDVPVTIYWKTDAPLSRDYIVFVQILDLNDQVVARRPHDTMPGGGLNPTSLWIPGKVVSDRIDLRLSRDALPGLYSYVAGMYTYPEVARLAVTTKPGLGVEDWVVLGQFKIAMGTSAQPSRVNHISLGAISLIGYDLRVTHAQVELALHWEAQERIDADYKVFVHLRDESGNIVMQQDRVPVVGRYPTHIWDVNERVVDPYSFSLANLPPGRYSVIAGMYSPITGERLITYDANGAAMPNREIVTGSFEVSPP